MDPYFAFVKISIFGSLFFPCQNSGSVLKIDYLYFIENFKLIKCVKKYLSNVRYNKGNEVAWLRYSNYRNPQLFS